MASKKLNDSYSVNDALRALAAESHLALLDGGSNGNSILCWGQPPQVSDSLDAVAVNNGHAQAAATATWPRTIDGGALVQIDYGFAVGPYAARSPHGGRARLWPLQTWLQWQDGGCQLHAGSDADLERAWQRLSAAPATLPAVELESALQAQWSREQYSMRIKKILHYIRQGDVYQVNLTMPFTGRCSNTSNQDISIFMQLREHSPAPYAAFFRDGDHSIISHSPERFLSAHNGSCASHPIKGTRKRIYGQEERIRDELLHAEKDRAELAMIMDLVRNDLGRIATPGSVSVEAERTLLDLTYVHHAVGHISCTLKPDVQHRDLLAACFPAGSITGAPKIRAMDIISELEEQDRGAYCGCFGWLGADYRCELAVAIRTMQMRGNTLRLDAGGGIVIDSDADSEWQELNDKVAAMQHSLGQTQCQ